VIPKLRVLPQVKDHVWLEAARQKDAEQWYIYICVYVCVGVCGWVCEFVQYKSIYTSIYT